jgi:hypothetical protein
MVLWSILFGEILIFHSRVMGLYSSNCRRFFICRTVNWEPLGQFTSNFVLLLELIVFTDFSKNGSELAKGFSIYSATYEKSPTIWWIKSHKSGMKNWNFTKKYTDHKTINSNNCAKFEVNWQRGMETDICPSIRPFHMSRSNLKTPWSIHFKFNRVIGIDGLTVDPYLFSNFNKRQLALCK